MKTLNPQASLTIAIQEHRVGLWLRRNYRLIKPGAVHARLFETVLEEMKRDTIIDKLGKDRFKEFVERMCWENRPPVRDFAKTYRFFWRPGKVGRRIKELKSIADEGCPMERKPTYRELLGKSLRIAETFARRRKDHPFSF
jgi:hypothetical protein